jgi:hypothetical protein
LFFEKVAKDTARHMQGWTLHVTDQRTSTVKHALASKSTSVMLRRSRCHETIGNYRLSEAGGAVFFQKFKPCSSGAGRNELLCHGVVECLGRKSPTPPLVPG